MCSFLDGFYFNKPKSYYLCHPTAKESGTQKLREHFYNKVGVQIMRQDFKPYLSMPSYEIYTSAKTLFDF